MENANVKIHSLRGGMRVEGGNGPHASKHVGVTL